MGRSHLDRSSSVMAWRIVGVCSTGRITTLRKAHILFNAVNLFLRDVRLPNVMDILPPDCIARFEYLMASRSLAAEVTRTSPYDPQPQTDNFLAAPVPFAPVASVPVTAVAAVTSAQAAAAAPATASDCDARGPKRRRRTNGRGVKTEAADGEQDGVVDGVVTAADRRRDKQYSSDGNRDDNTGSAGSSGMLPRGSVVAAMSAHDGTVAAAAAGAGDELSPPPPPPPPPPLVGDDGIAEHFLPVPPPPTTPPPKASLPLPVRPLAIIIPAQNEPVPPKQRPPSHFWAAATAAADVEAEDDGTYGQTVVITNRIFPKAAKPPLPHGRPPAHIVRQYKNRN